MEDKLARLLFIVQPLLSPPLWWHHTQFYSAEANNGD
jgi:hypothetical protein